MTSNTTVEDARRIPNTCYTVGGGNGQGRVNHKVPVWVGGAEHKTRRYTQQLPGT